jgi:hypothetical protein
MASSELISAPLFLVGAERSGTSLLRHMLDDHPQLAWEKEFEYAIDLLPPEGGFPSLPAYHCFLDINRVFQLSGNPVDPRLNYPELVNSFLIRKRAAKRLVGATVHRHFDRLLRLWPEARFVHLIRDGRDVARSVVEMGWAGTVWNGCNRWIEAETLWDCFSRDLPPDRHMTLRFEDLIRDPVRELSRICEFSGVKYHGAMLDYPSHSTYGPPDAKMVASWKRKLTPREVQLVEARIGPMLQARGYELSGHPALWLTPPLMSQIRRQDYVARVLFRIRRYGLCLVVGDFLSRRLRWDQMQRSLRRQMNAIDNLYLQ